MKTSILLALVAGAAAGLPVGLALSQSSPRLEVDVVMQKITGEIPRPARVEARLDRWAPGAETGPHHHPGPAILAVLEGELTEETPAGRTILRSGQVVWRAARREHNVKNTTDKPARVLAIHFDPVR